MFSNDFVDVLYAAKRSIRDIDRYRLENVCNLYNIDYTGAHRALKDCYLTKEAYDRINDNYGKDAFSGCVHEYCSSGNRSNFRFHFSEETQLKELQNILAYIIEGKQQGRIR